MAQNRQSGQQGHGQGGQNIDQYLQGVNFPCQKQELERVAQRNDAPRTVIDNIRQLPDRRFANLEEVRTAVGSLETTTR